MAMALVEVVNARAAARSAWLVVPLTVVPVVALLREGAGASWLWLGALAWVVALVVKIPMMAGLAFVVAPAWVQGLLAGALSALAELGVALLALARAPSVPGVFDVFLFAAAAGTLEALTVVAWAAMVRSPPAVAAKWGEAAGHSRVIRHQVLYERAVAWMGHFGSRSLIALAVVGEIATLGVVATITFVATDGVAAYLHERKVDWYAPMVLTRYLLFALALTLIELMVLGAYLVLAHAA